MVASKQGFNHVQQNYDFVSTSMLIAQLKTCIVIKVRGIFCCYSVLLKCWCVTMNFKTTATLFTEIDISSCTFMLKDILRINTFARCFSDNIVIFNNNNGNLYSADIRQGDGAHVAISVNHNGSVIIFFDLGKNSIGMIGLIFMRTTFNNRSQVISRCYQGCSFYYQTN